MDRPSAADRIRAATWFAERGFGIFPVWSTTPDGACRCPRGRACTSPGKHPIPVNGFKDATQDPARIATFLAAGSEPNYGMVPPDDVFVLDVDGDDLAKLADLEDRLGPLPQTLRTQTANGWHIFMRWPAHIPRPSGKLFGFVVRWKDSGYVIGPRSIHASGAEYQPNGIFEVVELPPTWGVPAQRAEHGPTIHIGDQLPGVGGRHDWLRDRARFFRGFIDDRATLRAAVIAENERLPQPKSAEEVERAIGDVFTKFPLDEPAAIEEKISRRLGEEEIGLVGPTQAGFPAPPDPVAFGGLIGDMVADIADGTDASLVGILGSLLAFCGALVPGQAYFHRTQTTSPFIALVGESTLGTKGTAMNRARDVMIDALDIADVNRVIIEGVNSGEALIATLAHKQETYKHDAAVALVFEEEYANLLASRGREGSTLDPKMRVAFDGGTISNRRAHDTVSVTPPYWLPALVGITPSELKRRLEQGALQSGSANRWLYLPVVKRDLMPANERPVFSPVVREQTMAARRWSLERMRTVVVEPDVTVFLAQYRDWLPRVSFGVASDLTRRFPVIAFRIALIHAMTERSEQVTSEHLARAMALVEYARRGISWVFGSTVGNQYSDVLLQNLRAFGRMRRTTITRELIRDPIKRQAAIDELIRLGLARIVTEQPEGRGGTVYWLEASSISTDFTDFLVSATAPPASTPASGNRSGSEHEWAENRSENDWKSVEIGGTGGTGSESETITCSDYRAHQTQHYRTASGWVCPVCTPPIH